jgi:hypothetical protein
MTGPVVAGGTVILSGEFLEAALQAVLVAARDRRRNGVPVGPKYAALISALSTGVESAECPTVAPKRKRRQGLPSRAVTVDQAAEQLGITPRQVRRLAAGPLRGKRINGRWYIPQAAITKRKGTTA